MNNKLLGEKFAKDFNKRFGIITYSGTLAIEAALMSLGLKENSKVLVMSETCYSITNAILKLNLDPVIVTCKNELFMTNEDIDKVLETQDIDCIMLVHQYGILNNIDTSKYRKMGIKIIEDIAQSWTIKSNDYTVGINSDIVVTSFGKTKPLSYGIGGGLFFDDESTFNSMDYYDNESREKETVLLSYSYPKCEEINYEELKKLADHIVKEQQNNAKKYYKLLKNIKTIKCIKYSDNSSWHRYPIWFEDYELFNKVVNEIKNTELEYQLQHEVNLVDLNRNKECISIDNRNQKQYIILLRTRNIDINKQINGLKHIIKDLV